MNSPKKSMVSAIKALAQHQEERLTNHPEPEDLADYQDGLLPDPRNKEIQAHLAICRKCMLDFAELAAIDETEEIAQPAQPDKRAIQESVKRRFGFDTGLMAAGFAAIAFASLAGNIALYFSKTPSRPQTEISVLDLIPVNESGERSGEEEEIIRTVSRRDGLVLFLNLIETTENQIVRARILSDDAQGRMLWISDQISIPDSNVLPIKIPGSFLEPGRYRVQLLEEESKKEIAGFLFELTKKSGP